MIQIDPQSVYAPLLVFVRATGLFLLLPVFSATFVPRMVRVAIAAGLGYLLAPVALPGLGFPAHWYQVLLEVLHELLAGLAMGLATRLLFHALEMAGEIISVEIGLSMGTNIDPITRTSATPPNTMLYYFGVLLFLVTGMYRYTLVAFLRSYDVLPVTESVDPGTASFVVSQTARVFLIAVQIASPMFALNFLINLAFSVLGRAAPSLNVFALSFSVRILAGLWIFGMTFALTSQYVLSELRGIPELMLKFLR